MTSAIVQRLILTILLGLGILLAASSCALHRLNVQTQYLSHEYLASYHVGTPDPCLQDPIIGQRLLIEWSLCAKEIKDQEIFLFLKIRFHNHQEQEMKVPITSKRGHYLYYLTNEAYCQSGGVLTYNAEIRSSTCTLASWKHPLWANLIKFDFSNLESTPQEKKMLCIK